MYDLYPNIHTINITLMASPVCEVRQTFVYGAHFVWISCWTPLTKPNHRFVPTCCAFGERDCCPRNLGHEWLQIYPSNSTSCRRGMGAFPSICQSCRNRTSRRRQMSRIRPLAVLQPSPKRINRRRADDTHHSQNPCYQMPVIFATPRNGHFPTPRFGHFPTPKTVIFQHNSVKSSTEFSPPPRFCAT
jgi:hypothetical protein